MVYLFLAEGFEEIEALTPVDVLRRGGVELTTVGVGGKTVCGSHGIVVEADISDTEFDPSDAQAVILPGGMPGTLNLGKSYIVMGAVKKCLDEDKLVAAICAAPSLLGQIGALRGKRATAFPGFEDKLEGAVYEGGFVEHDGNIITGKGMGVALEFALEILSALRGEKTAEKVRASLQCRM